MQNTQDVQHAAAFLKNRLPDKLVKNLPSAIGLVLGTGLGEATAFMQPLARVPFGEIPHFPGHGANFHQGEFLAGFAGQVPVLTQSGRRHLYEGHTPAQICMGVCIMGALGIKTLIITNAAGALNPLFNTGDLMCMSDMINHTGQSPLTGPNNDSWGDRFPDMSEPFDRKLQTLAMDASLALGMRLERGVYIGVSGPQMETPAETRMYRQWGADAVGMSSVLEIIAARHMGMEVLGLSALTNKNLPDCMRPASVEEIVAAARECAPRLTRLIGEILRRLPAPHITYET